MPFGMKRYLATFQRLINSTIAGLEHYEVYIDDAIIYNDKWNHHLATTRAFFYRLSEAILTIYLSLNKFCHAHLTFLGHVVGQSQIRPMKLKLKLSQIFRCLQAKDN